MAQNHPVNLLNEKDLNQFIADIIYFGEKPDSFETAELRDLSYVKEHKDAVIRAMVYQWFKTRLRSFLTTDTKQNRKIPLQQHRAVGGKISICWVALSVDLKAFIMYWKHFALLKMRPPLSA